jgi:Transcriptional regulator, AbiEi antitoxin
MDTSALLARRGGFILSADLERAGRDARVLRMMRDRGELVRIRRGAYVPIESWQESTSLDRHLLRIQAAESSLPHESTFSHYSAAALHGLPILGSWPSDVHVIGARHRGGHGETGLRRHGTISLPEPVEIGRFRVTSVARTVVDLARVCSLRSAVVTADRAQANALKPHTVHQSASRDDLVAELATVPRRAGGARAELAVNFSDGYSGSAGESISRVAFWELGIPQPQLQRRFVDAEGEMFVDFYWEYVNSIGEFDGQSKYFQPEFNPSLSPNEILWQEKLRQNRLLAFTPRIARWDWDVALNPRLLLARLASIGVYPR